MKVLQVGFKDPFGSGAGGVESVIRELYNRSIKIGDISMDIIYASESSSEEGIAASKLITIRIPPLRFLPKGSTAAKKIIYNRKICDFIKANKESYDLIHFHGDNGDYHAINELNSVTTFHGFSLTYANTLNFFAKQVVYFASSRYEIKKANQSTRLIAVSNKVRSEILSTVQVDRNMDVIHNGVHTGLYTPVDKRRREEIRRQLGLAVSKRYVLFVGLDPVRKGLDIAQQTVSALKTNDVCMLVMGIDNPTYDSRSQNILFLGWQDELSKIKYYQAADVFIAPSRYEGFSVAPIEAMSCGLPVIASYATGLNEILTGREAIVMDTSDPMKNAEKLDQLLSDYSLASEIGTSARKCALNYDWSEVAKKYFRVYQSLV